MLGYEIKFKYFHSLSCKRNLVCTIYVGFGVIRIHGSYKLKTQWCSVHGRQGVRNGHPVLGSSAFRAAWSSLAAGCITMLSGLVFVHNYHFTC